MCPGDGERGGRCEVIHSEILSLSLPSSWRQSGEGGGAETHVEELTSSLSHSSLFISQTIKDSSPRSMVGGAQRGQWFS